eukprot:scaffold1234_cov248-Pinguiococcus_pyrenoidosus.AAC.22
MREEVEELKSYTTARPGPGGPGRLSGANQVTSTGPTRPGAPHPFSTDRPARVRSRLAHAYIARAAA